MGIARSRAGKHVLIEKPLAGSVYEAEQLVAAAREGGRVLMVDHTYVYSGPVQKMKQIIESGDLGDVYFIDSVRINLGMFQHDVNVVWDLAPTTYRFLIISWDACRAVSPRLAPATRTSSTRSKTSLI